MAMRFVLCWKAILHSTFMYQYQVPYRNGIGSLIYVKPSSMQLQSGEAVFICLSTEHCKLIFVSNILFIFANEYISS